MIYRICESVNDFLWGQSDWRSARDEIAGVIQQAHKIQNGQHSNSVAAALGFGSWPTPAELQEAERVLNLMVQNYSRA